MKIELQIEEQYNRPPWYMIVVDEEYVEGFQTLEQAQAFYDKLKESPEILKKTIKVLESHEIVVPLEEENNNE